MSHSCRNRQDVYKRQVQKRLAGMQVGFRINTLHVRVRRAGCDAELFGDFCLRKAHGIEREHFGFAIGKQELLLHFLSARTYDCLAHFGAGGSFVLNAEQPLHAYRGRLCCGGFVSFEHKELKENELSGNEEQSAAQRRRQRS